MREIHRRIEALDPSDGNPWQILLLLECGHVTAMPVHIRCIRCERERAKNAAHCIVPERKWAPSVRRIQRQLELQFPDTPAAGA